MSFEGFRKSGRASFVLGGQWGSEGKGAACAYLATQDGSFDIVTANNGAQSGHVSVHNGVTRTQFHLPTYSVWPQKRQPLTYLNGGSIIDPELLLRELDDNPHVASNFAIHPNAAIITPDCKEAEGRDDSAQTKIASTRKGVGEALSRKILRSGLVMKDYSDPAGLLPENHPIYRLQQHVRRIDLNEAMDMGRSVLVEIPQGHSLSIDSQFYPHTTSRNCTVGQAMADAGIHPSFYHASMLVIRTYPIRVGGIYKEATVGSVAELMGVSSGVQLGDSGSCYPDQSELSWAQLGQKPEITTVTKRQRRVFSFSEQQVAEAIASTRPDVIFLSFMDYLPHLEGPDDERRPAARGFCKMIRELSGGYGLHPEILTQWGPSTSDVIREEDL